MNATDFSPQEQPIATAQHRNVAKTGLLINRNFALLTVGQSISQFGDFVVALSLMVWVITKVAPTSWAPLAISCMTLALYAPNLLFGLFAGVFVDRWQHRQTMIRMDFLRAALIAFLLLFLTFSSLIQHLSPIVTIAIVCTEIFLESICSLFFNPATTGLIGQIVPSEQLPAALGRSQTLYSAAKLIGPLLGPILYFAVGIFWCLTIDIVSFLISVATLWAIRVAFQERPSNIQPNFWREFAQGVGVAFQNRILRMLIVTSFLVVLGVGSFDSLFLFFVERNLHSALSLSGLLVSAMAIGTIVGALTLSHFATTLGLTRLLWSSITACGILFAVYSRLTNFALAILVIFLIGFMMTGMQVTIGPLLLKHTPPELVGRVSATLGAFSIFGTTISTVLAGFLAGVVLASLHVQLLGTTFGPIDTIFLGGACLFTFAGLYALFAVRKKNA